MWQKPSWLDRLLARYGLVLIKTPFKLSDGKFSYLVKFERAWWAERFFYERINDLERRIMYELKASDAAMLEQVARTFRVNLKREETG